MLSKIDLELYNLDDAICRHIDNISRDSRGVVSQDVLSDLRHYVEHIMFKIYDDGRNLEVTYDNIQNAIGYIFSTGKYKLLRDFHKILQIVVSHYKPTEENSERLMLKYYEYLFRIRTIMNKDYSLNLLHNLEKFPLNMDPKLMEYYQKTRKGIRKINSCDTDYFYPLESNLCNASGSFWLRIYSISCGCDYIWCYLYKETRSKNSRYRSTTYKNRRNQE